MKKKLFALALCFVTIVALFSFGACKRGGNDDDNTELPAPPPVDTLAALAGVWKIERLDEISTDESGMPPSDPIRYEGYRLNIKADGAFTLTGYDLDQQQDFAYAGTAVVKDADYYYRFTCTMGETTVTSEAYLYLDFEVKRLSFTSISFQGGDYYKSFSSCICVPAAI